MPERRLMEETRRRVDEIASSMEAHTRDLDRRYRRVAWLLGAMVVGGMVAVLAGYSLLQGQRWESVVLSCDARNQQADATVALLRDVGADGRVILAAQVRYPHTPPLAHRSGDVIVLGPGPGYRGPMSCAESADRQVGWLRL